MCAKLNETMAAKSHRLYPQTPKENTAIYVLEIRSRQKTGLQHLNIFLI